MKPFTNHAVLTVNSAVCHGGHFLSASNIRQTCLGFLATFTMSTLLTNTDHTSETLTLFHSLLECWSTEIMNCPNRMFSVPDLPGSSQRISNVDDNWPAHVPNIRTFEGIYDLFSLLNLVEISEVVHYQTYAPLSLPHEQRLILIDARAKSRQLVEWILARRQLDSSDITLPQFYWKYLTYQVRAICAAKTFAESQDTFSYDQKHIAKRVEALVYAHFDGIQPFWDEWGLLDGTTITSFAWSPPGQCTVGVRRPITEGQSLTQSNYPA